MRIPLGGEASPSAAGLYGFRGEAAYSAAKTALPGPWPDERAVWCMEVHRW